MPKISKIGVFGLWSQDPVLFVPFEKYPRAKPVIPWPSLTYHCEEEGYPVSFCIETLRVNDMWNLVVVLPIWPWYIIYNFPKLTKKDWILSAAPKLANFANFWQSRVKIGIFFHKASMQKVTGSSSSSSWYVELCCGITGLDVLCNFQIVTKKDWILSVALKHANYAIFRR